MTWSDFPLHVILKTHREILFTVPQRVISACLIRKQMLYSSISSWITATTITLCSNRWLATGPTQPLTAVADAAPFQERQYICVVYIVTTWGGQSTVFKSCRMPSQFACLRYALKSQTESSTLQFKQQECFDESKQARQGNFIVIALFIHKADTKCFTC